MNINIWCYFLFGMAGGLEIDHTFVKFISYPLTMIAFILFILHFVKKNAAKNYCII